MRIRTVIHGATGIAIACLLAGGAARAETGTAADAVGSPTSRDSGLRQPATNPDRAPVTEDSTATPGGPTSARDSGTGMTDSQAGMTESQANNGARNLSSGADPDMVSVTGRIQTVDRADGTIVIEGVDRQLKLDPSSDVTRNGSNASISDVREGEQVRASFDDGFPAHVRQLEIMSPGRAPSTSDTATGTGTGAGSTSPSDASGRTTAPSDTGAVERAPDTGLLPRRESSGSTSVSGSAGTR